MAGPVEWCSPDNHTCSFMSQPFVKPVRKNQAPTPPNCVTKGGLLRCGLGHGVDRLQTDGRLLGPVGNETPTHKAKDALGLRSVLADGRNLLRRSDVPAWCPGRIFVETKVVSNITLLRCKAIAAAHGAPVYQRHETIPRDLE